MTAKTAAAALDKARERRKSLIPLLQRIQEAEGHLSPAAIRSLARSLKLSESDVYGVATFFAQFRFKPPGKYNIKVCLGTACHVGGGQNFMEVMKTDKRLDHGETTPDGRFSLERVACLGCCALAPVVVVNHDVHGRMNRVSFTKLIEALDAPEPAEPA